MIAVAVCASVLSLLVNMVVLFRLGDIERDVASLDSVFSLHEGGSRHAR